MGIVGVKSTAGRAVKCIDPGKTTRSESAWLGYLLCETPALVVRYSETTHTSPQRACTDTHTHTHTHTPSVRSASTACCLSSIRVRWCKPWSRRHVYNEERRLGVQRGSDTLVVPLFTSNDGLSIAFSLVNTSTCKWACSFLPSLACGSPFVYGCL